MSGGDLVLAGLLALNGALYASLLYLVLVRRARSVEPSNLGEAFVSLELALKQAVPALPSGFTWEEAVARLRSSGVQTQGLEGALRSYEAYRYGGGAIPDTDYREVVRIARSLGRGKRSGGVQLGR